MMMVTAATDKSKSGLMFTPAVRVKKMVPSFSENDKRDTRRNKKGCVERILSYLLACSFKQAASND